MKNVISLQKQKEHHEKYMQTLIGAVEILYDVAERLLKDSMNLVNNGVWKEWSDSQPAGAECEFTDKMLLDSGDENVKDMISLRMKISDLADTFQERYNVLRKKGER